MLNRVLVRVVSVNEAITTLLLIAQQVAAVAGVLLTSTNLWTLFPPNFRAWVFAASVVDLVIIRVLTTLKAMQTN